MYYLEFNCLFDLTPSKFSFQESPNHPSPWERGSTRYGTRTLFNGARLDELLFQYKHDKVGFMTTASLNELKKEILTLDIARVQELCLRLAKYKKENKELLSYLLFEAHDENKYVEGVKLEMEELFKALPEANTYYIKKSLRKILRVVNRHIKYSGIKSTEIGISRLRRCISRIF